MVMDKPIVTGAVARGGGHPRKCTDTLELQAVTVEWLGRRHVLGTLNVWVVSESLPVWNALRDRPWRAERQPEGFDRETKVRLYRLEISGSVRTVGVTLDSALYPHNSVELLAAENLRDRLGLQDSDPVTLTFV